MRLDNLCDLTMRIAYGRNRKLDCVAKSRAVQPEGTSGVKDLLGITQLAGARDICAQENLVTSTADHLRSVKAKAA